MTQTVGTVRYRPTLLRLGTGLFVTYSLLLSCVLSFATSAPLEHEIIRRPLHARANGDDSVGFGVEIETRFIELFNTNPILDPDSNTNQDQLKDNTKKIKTSPLDTGVEASHLNWEITAEVESDKDSRKLVVEFILDGTKIKIGDGQAVTAIQEIYDYLDNWAPCKAKGSSASIPNVKDLGTWNVQKPTSKYNKALIFDYVGTQITLPLPLESVYDLIANSKGVNIEHPETSILRSRLLPISDLPTKQRLHLVSTSHFEAEFGGIKLQQDVLGFLSLVVGYAKGPSKIGTVDAAKKITSIMPRTDFKTMYSQVKDRLLKCKNQEISLHDMIKALAKYKGDGTDDHDEIFFDEKTFDSTVFKYSNPLKVGDWLDSLDKGGDDLSARDEQDRFSQVGGLKDRMETVIGSNRLVPLFEMRDLSAPFHGITEFLRGADAEAQLLHQNRGSAPSRRSLNSRAFDLTPESGLVDEDSTCEAPDGGATCPPGQARFDTLGECEECPEGEEPTEDQTECKGIEDPLVKPDNGECPEGKILDPAEGGQDAKTKDPVCIDDPKCKQGEVGTSLDRDDPSKDGDKSKCVKDIKDEDKPRCSGHQYAFITEENDSAKYECRNTRKSDHVSKEDNDQRKADEEKKSARGRFCLAFMAGSGLVEGGEMFETDEGAKVLNDSALEWPDTAIWTDGDLSESNVDVDVKLVETIGLGGEIETRKRSHLSKRQGFLKIFGSLTKGGRAADDAAAAAAKTSAALKAAAVKNGGYGRAAEQDAGKIAALKKLSPAERTKKATDALRKIRDNPSFLDCLTMVATTVADASLHIDDVPEGGFEAVDESNQIKLYMEPFEKHGGSDELSRYNAQTYTDVLFHDNRIIVNKCMKAVDSVVDIRSQVTGYGVSGGCCTFYGDDGCTQHLFTAANREDLDLEEHGHDNVIRAFACTQEISCNGNP